MMTKYSKAITFCAKNLKFIVTSIAISAILSSPVFADKQPLVYIINIDVLPPFTIEAVKLLKTYRVDTVKEKGVKRVELLQRLEHGNHFALIEEWSTQADYDAHLSAEKTRTFRNKLQPMLGSPYDERVHHPLN